MSEVTPVIVMNESILDMIEATFGIKKNDVLQAIAISKVGHKHIEQFNTEVVSGADVLANNIKPILPNSRFLVMIQLTWAGTEPDILWRKVNGNDSVNGMVLTTVQATKVKTGEYEWDEPVTRDTEYNIRADQDCTFTYMIIIEYAIGF